MLLAHLPSQRITPDQPATPEHTQAVLNEALTRIDDEAHAVLDGLTAVETKTLRAIAEYATPLAARASHDLDLKSPPPPRPSGVPRGLAEHTDAAWRLAGPLLGSWLRRHYPTRP